MSKWKEANTVRGVCVSLCFVQFVPSFSFAKQTRKIKFIWLKDLYKTAMCSCVLWLCECVYVWAFFVHIVQRKLICSHGSCKVKDSFCANSNELCLLAEHLLMNLFVGTVNYMFLYRFMSSSHTHTLSLANTVRTSSPFSVIMLNFKTIIYPPLSLYLVYFLFLSLI